MPDNPADDVATATLEARDAIDSAERLNERLEESDKLIDAFDDKPSNPKDPDDLDPTADSAQDDPITTNFSEPPSNPDDNDDVIQDPVEKPDHSQEPAQEDSTHDHQQESDQQNLQVESAEPEKGPTEDEIEAAAAKAAATAAVSVVALTASLPTAVTVPNIPLQTMQATAYTPFVPLAPNAAQLVAHPLVSMPVSTTRRAVRIAPMGVLPLPPHNANPLVADIPAATPAIMAAAQEASVDGQIACGTGTIGEMPKGKRRGLSVAVIPSEALTPEERTKQKRMLRNRESAARSRDKRKNKNLQLEGSIARHRAKRELIDKSIEDLQGIVQTMQDILKKHDIPVPT